LLCQVKPIICQAVINPRKRGFDKFPYVVFETGFSSDIDYPQDSPGINALADVKQLMTMVKEYAKAVKKIVCPTYKGPATLKNKKMADVPGAYIEEDENGRGISPVYEVNPRILELKQEKDELKNAIKEHFYNDLFAMILSTAQRGRTATEVNGIVFDMPKVIGENAGAMSVFTTAKECEEQIAKLFELVLYRNNTYKEAIENGNKVEEFEHLFVVINSLSMLKAALSDQGKEKLALILEKGTKEYNINIILAEQVKNISSVSFEKWYKANVSPSDGLWIGSGITEQYQMKANKTTSEMHEDITPEFGYSLIKGKCVKLKLLNNKAEEEEDDE